MTKTFAQIPANTPGRPLAASCRVSGKPPWAETSSPRSHCSGSINSLFQRTDFPVNRDYSGRFSGN